MAEVEAPEGNLAELEQKHQNLEERLEKLESPRSMSPEEEYEAQQIKKQKLAIKDKMAALRDGSEADN